jgi:hypothetical protein
VVFAVTDNKRPLPLFSEERATSGRLFYKNGELNVIFGAINGEFQDQFRATGYMRAFATGSRSRQQEQRWEVIPAGGMRYASASRKDWLQINPMAWEHANDASPTGSPTPRSPASGRDTAAATAPEPQPQASSTKPPATVQKTTVATDHYSHFEERLRTLRRLRENGLITDEEYQNKRRAILEEL